MILGREQHRHSRFPYSLAHLTSNTQTTTILTEQKTTLGNSTSQTYPSVVSREGNSTPAHLPPSISRGRGRESNNGSTQTIFDVMNTDFEVA